MSAAACTIVARNTLAYARVLARSWRQHHPEVPFVVLMADEVGGYFDPAAEPFTIIALRDIGLPDVEHLRFRYSQQPLTYACSPFFLAHLLAGGYRRVIYFKQETLILGDVTGIFDRLAESPIVVTPHLVAPLAGADAEPRELNILLSGVYNVGVLGVAAHPATDRFLTWWHDRLATGCRHDVAGGMHYEQRWIDLALGYFDGIHVLRDPAFNIGHWSLPERRIAVAADGAVTVDGRPCRVFRCSGYDPDHPDEATRYNRRLTPDLLGDARIVFRRFHDALQAEGHGEVRDWPYAYGAFDNGVPVPDAVRHLFAEVAGSAGPFGDPLRTSGPNSFWTWMTTPEPGTSISRFWSAVHRWRPDLQQAFPDLHGADAPRFREWTRQSGFVEYRVPERLLEHAS